jgi:prepilin-type N-terminal cleavage/methylation domain-containing protein
MILSADHLNPAGKRRCSRAFTLLEVLAATVIAAIILSAVFAGISGTFALLTASREDLRATQIILSRLEGLRLEAWGNGDNQPSQLFNTTMVPRTFTDYFYPLGLNSTTNQGTVYGGTVSISTNITLKPAASYSSGIAYVVVSLTWTNRNYGVTTVRSRSMSTLVAQNGIQNYVYTH